VQGCIFDIKRFAIHDGPGIRITIFLKGCSLDCWWCHNPEGIRSEQEILTKEITIDGKIIEDQVEVGKWYTVEDLMVEIEKERIFMDESGGGVTFSGGEPLLQYDFLKKSLKACRKGGIHTCLDTSGDVNKDKMKEISSLTDLILYDLKLINDMEHREYTGKSNKLILDNLELLYKQGTELVIRIPIIPGINNDHRHLDEFIDHLSKMEKLKRIDLLPYHRFAANKYKQFKYANRMNGVEDLSSDEVSQIATHFENKGFDVKIGG